MYMYICWAENKTPKNTKQKGIILWIIVLYYNTRISGCNSIRVCYAYTEFTVVKLQGKNTWLNILVNSCTVELLNNGHWEQAFCPYGGCPFTEAETHILWGYNYDTRIIIIIIIVNYS